MEANSELYERKKVAMDSGIADVRPHVPFVVNMVNLSDSTVTIFKKQTLETAIAAPVTQEIAITFKIDDASGESASAFQAQRPLNATATVVPENTAGKLTLYDIVLDSLAANKQ